MRVVWALLRVYMLVSLGGVWADRDEGFEADLKGGVDSASSFTPSINMSSDSMSTFSSTNAAATTTPAIFTTTHLPTTTTTHASTPYPTTTSQLRPVDCADHLMTGANISGVYEIYPFTCTCKKAVPVWCDMEADGGGWTVILKRQVQRVQLDFNRTWDEYSDGFGAPHKEHWLGNEVLHLMTNGREYTLFLDMTDASGSNHRAFLEVIRVEGENRNYIMRTGGAYSGTSVASRCLSTLRYNRKFSTFDRDNEYFSGNCAAIRGGGWWWYNCRYFNPTSPYNETLNIIPITCYHTLQVTRLQLKIRPKICDDPIKTIHLKSMGCGCPMTGTDWRE